MTKESHFSGKETFLYSVRELDIIFTKNLKFFQKNIGVNGVCIDTRKLKKNFAFIAIKGKNQDGHNFIKKAIRDGASLIICTEIPVDVKESHFFRMCNFILINDPEEALIKLAEYNRERSLKTTKLIAVTGSIGKTTTKELIANLLERFFNISYTEKNYNSQIGQPLTLANVPLNTDVIVLEAGMSKRGELRRMTHIIKPDIVIITTIAVAHTEFFDSIEDIARAKAEIFEGMTAGGIVILNEENEYYPILVEEAKKNNIKNIFNIGKKTSHLYIDSYKFDENLYQTNYVLKVNTPKKKEIFESHIQGMSYHSAFNTLFPVAIGLFFKLDIKKCLKIISNSKIFEGRGNIEKIQIENKQLIVINDSYNCSPEALKAALNSINIFGEYHKSRKVAIIGDMLEQGKNSLAFHLKIADFILNETSIDVIITVGTETKVLYDKLKDTRECYHFDETRFLIKKVRKLVKDQDVILAKGSTTSMGFNRIIDTLRR